MIDKFERSMVGVTKTHKASVRECQTHVNSTGIKSPATDNMRCGNGRPAGHDLNTTQGRKSKPTGWNSPNKVETTRRKPGTVREPFGNRSEPHLWAQILKTASNANLHDGISKFQKIWVTASDASGDVGRDAQAKKNSRMKLASACFEGNLSHLAT